jgi:DNA-binding HxlR family transcriptional regulator
MTEDRTADFDLGSPTHLALHVLGHKWTLLILVALQGGPQRFTRLRSMIPRLTSQVLTASLRDLERDGVVDRRDFSAVPPHVEYSLTPLGSSLFEPALAIRAWAEKNGPDVVAARQRYDDGSQS